ncbi:MAG TPA: dual specificity protein phosphatase [Blastocatellia bacterium]|nr:dual specificity protein phosphatase [Blastocatellia bacterium]
METYFDVQVEEIEYYPPIFDFLLSHFPHTVVVKLRLGLTASAGVPVEAWIEFSSAEVQGTVLMLSRVEAGRCILEGTLRPPKPGLYRFSVVLSVGGRRLVVEQGERTIIGPRPFERWTHGPLAIAIEPGLFLGNAAAAADPEFLEELVSREGPGSNQVAVVNAAGEREPGPALLGARTRSGTRFVYRRFPFEDFSHNPMHKEAVWQAVIWIHEQLERGPVLVHCHAGIGRSASLVVAYLRLLRHPDKSYDEVVAMIKEAARRQGHDIFPHVGLPEALKELQGDERRQKELAALLGRESYDYLPEPAGEVRRVAFAGGYEVGQTRTVEVGTRVVVQASVDYTGAEPQGVYVHTNLNGAAEEILMRRAEGNVYQAEVEASLAGDNFWLTVSATTRRYDHSVRRKWIGGDIHFNVVGR